VSALLPQDASNKINVFALPHKRGGNKIHVLWDPKIGQVRDVLLRQSGEVDNGTGKIHILPLSNGGGVLHLQARGREGGRGKERRGGGEEGRKGGREMRWQINHLATYKAVKV